MLRLQAGSTFGCRCLHQTATNVSQAISLVIAEKPIKDQILIPLRLANFHRLDRSASDRQYFRWNYHPRTDHLELLWIRASSMAWYLSLLGRNRRGSAHQYRRERSATDDRGSHLGRPCSRICRCPHITSLSLAPWIRVKCISDVVE